MLRQAILQAGDDPTLATVSAWLPPDFFSADTDELAANESEFADALATMAAEQATEQPIEFEGAPEPTPASTAVAATPVDAEPIKEPPTLTFQEARDAITGWSNKLSLARGALMSAVARQQAGRDALAAAIGQFVSGFPAKTRESLQREYLASEAERRQRVADGLEPPTGGTREVPTGFLTAMRRGQRGNSVNRGYGNNYVKKAASLIAQQQAAGLKPAVSTVPKER
jgi:hypothetical protein